MRNCPACLHLIWPWQRTGQCKSDQSPAHKRCHEVVHNTLKNTTAIIEKLENLLGISKTSAKKGKKTKIAIGVY